MEEENKQQEITKVGVEENATSYFDGDPWKFFFLKLGLLLLKIITLWFAQPYCEVKKNQYELSHTVIDGRRLKFIGTASGIFKINILWNILTFFTVFTMSFWKMAKIKKWVIENTVFEDYEEMYDTEETKSEFKGSYAKWVGLAAKGVFLSIITLFFMTPYAIHEIKTYTLNNTYVSGKLISLEISYKEFRKKWINWMLLSIVTFGVYLVFLNVKQRRYLIQYTHIVEDIKKD